VAGLAAMLFSIKPTASPQEVKQTILNSTDVSPQLQGKVAGAGRVNFCRASNLIQHGDANHASCAVKSNVITTTTMTSTMSVTAAGKIGAPPTRTYTLTCDFEGVIHESIFCNEWTTTSVCADDAPRWKVWQRSTPSVQTGPSGAASKLHFVHIEATHMLETDIAYLTSGEHQMLVGQKLSFAYHMFGRDIGTLGVQWAPVGSTAWTLLWQISGNQGNQWRGQVLDLAPLAGNKARVRFFATGGRGAYADIALDKVTFHGAAEAPLPQNNHMDTSSSGSESAEIRGVIVFQLFTNQTANLTSLHSELGFDGSLYRILGIVSWVHYMTVTTDPTDPSVAHCLGGLPAKCQPVPNALLWKSWLDENPGYSLVVLGYLVDNVLGTQMERCAARLATGRLQNASNLESDASLANRDRGIRAMVEFTEDLKTTLAPLGFNVSSVQNASPRSDDDSGFSVLWVVAGLLLIALIVTNIVLAVRICNRDEEGSSSLSSHSSDEEEIVE